MIATKDINKNELPLKIIITGVQCTGKYELGKILLNSNKEFKFGKLLSDRPENEQHLSYNSEYLEYMSTDDIKLSFENDALLFISNYHNTYYEGLTKTDFERNNLFILTPEQVVNIPSLIFSQYRILIVWMDAKYSTRRARFINEERKYDFMSQENYDNEDVPHMIEFLRDKECLYFLNESAERISPIINVLYKEPQIWMNAFLNAYKG